MKFTFFQIAIIALKQTIKVAADFTSIGGDYQNVASVNIDVPCSGLQNIPNTMFTIQPSNTADSADVKTAPQTWLLPQSPMLARCLSLGTLKLPLLHLREESLLNSRLPRFNRSSFLHKRRLRSLTASLI